MKLKKIWNSIKQLKGGSPLNLAELGEYLKELGIKEEDLEIQQDISETIYFICLKHLAESLGKMQWEKRIITEKKGKEKIFDNKLDMLLNIRPNPYMSAITFWQTLELNRNHYGNAYIYVERDNKGDISHLWQLPSTDVEIWVDDKGYFGKENNIWYVWTDQKTSMRYSFSKEDVLHFKTHMSWDGLAGMPVRDIIRAQMNIQKSSLKFLKKIYNSGTLGSKVIVHYAGEMKKEKAQLLVKDIEEFAKSKTSGAFIPLPHGMQAQLLDMKLADAQFFENNKNSALQIAAAFGIKPNVVNDYTKSSYSNSETQQLDFYVNTLQPLFLSYEQELTYKLMRYSELEKGYRLAINENTLFKMDNQTKASVYSAFVQNFIMTPNEAREELNLPYVEGGDKLIGNGNAITLEKAGDQYNKGGETNKNSITK
ncbi:phage portal protein [Fusobacterium varium]|uniref:phage portal protein n=1 Tax=Fusobacterium varium TaxID=856 RepID=UPI000E3FFEAE|nr:phage portal protein [Fusobacterium varium]RGJ31215.1 phage portal protein [Fusobacterium varium]